MYVRPRRGSGSVHVREGMHECAYKGGHIGPIRLLGKVCAAKHLRGGKGGGYARVKVMIACTCAYIVYKYMSTYIHAHLQ